MPPGRKLRLAISAAAALGLAAAALQSAPRLALLAVIGLFIGVTLHHASVGFTGAYRALIVHRDPRGVVAQLVMVAAGTVLMAPLLAQGRFFGMPLGGAVAPAGVSVVAGAFVFGIGMQLAGGCGSGTLHALGTLRRHAFLTIVAFCAGAFWASLHMDWWQSLAAYHGPALGERLGWGWAVALQLGVLLTLAAVLRRRLPLPVGDKGPTMPRVDWLCGPWPLLAGALILALLNALTLAAAGHPWSITWAFTLWGAKAATALGWVPAGSAFWGAGFQRSALESSTFSDATSVMDLAIVIGVFAASAAAARPRGRVPVGTGPWIAAALGGIAMGYGARIAYGCNIGAFFSGVASTSLHGWLWIVAALPGNWLGVKLRPMFGLRL